MYKQCRDNEALFYSKRENRINQVRGDGHSIKISYCFFAPGNV
jgi:hypothetical protein